MFEYMITGAFVLFAGFTAWILTLVRDDLLNLRADVEHLYADFRRTDEYFNARFSLVESDIRDIVTPTIKKKEVKRAKAK